ncbi:MAG: hypothetical protein JWQ77_383 [Jatrophihabitans sp.]|nr:hypothetical protein [Jatrophihabitans sp.]
MTSCTHISMNHRNAWHLPTTFTVTTEQGNYWVVKVTTQATG